MNNGKVAYIPSGKEQTFHWIENKFISFREIFPTWGRGYEGIKRFCDNFRYELEFKENHFNFNVITGSPDVPEDDQDAFMEIYKGCFKDYFPLDDYLYERMEDQHSMMKRIESDIERREKAIVYSGGRSFKDELKFRLGVLPL